MESPVLIYSTNSDNSDPSWMSTLYLVGTLVCSLIVIPSYSRFKKYFRKQKGNEILGLDAIPGPKPFIPINLIGSLPSFLPISKSLDKGLQWFQEYPLGKANGANKTFVGFNTPDLVQQLFRSTDFDHGVKAPLVYGNMKPFISNGVLVSSGKFWQGQRKILTRSQSLQSIKAYVGCLNEHSEQFVEELEMLFQDGKPHSINGAINTLFLKIICEMITGSKVDSSTEFERYHHNFKVWRESQLLRMVQPWLLLNPLWRLHPMSRRYYKAVEKLNEFARKCASTHQRIETHRERRQNQEIMTGVENGAGTTPFKCVLDELMDEKVSEDQILDEVNTMIFGGHETGATAIHFFCFSMALNPEIQELCRKEIDEVFENSGNFNKEAITL